MDLRKTVRDFYHAFENMNTKELLSLCAPQAKILSPVFGHKDSVSFFTEAFSHTKSIKIHVKDIYINPDKPTHLAAYLSFVWEMKNRPAMNFEGVVLFNFTTQGKIQQIEIIYDAERARSAVA